MQDRQHGAEAAVRRERHGAALVLRAGGLMGALGALAAALEEAFADGTLGAIVLALEMAAGEGAESPAELAALCQRIEAAGKPVVVVVEGALAGGGVELALAAAFRVATPGATLALPQVAAGLLPGAGGTQRLPRLVGAREALAMMLGGAPVTAEAAFASGLVDLVVPGDAVAAALVAAGEMMARDWRPLRAAARALGDPAAHMAAVAESRARPAGLPAAARIVDCVEAALILPLAQGLAFERAAYDDLAASEEAQALAHAMRAETLAFAVPPALAEAAAHPPGAVALWGAGAGASDLAAQAVLAGVPVRLVEPDRARLVAALERVATQLEREMAEGRQSLEARDAAWARLTPSLVPEELAADLGPPSAGAGLVFCAEAAGPLPEACRAYPQIALNTAAPPGGVALQAGAGAGQLAELSAWPEAPRATRALGLAFARALRWRVVLAGNAGQIERRLLEAMAAVIAEAERQGASHRGIALALAAFGIGAPEGGRAGPPQPGDPGAAEVGAACLAALANAGGRMLSDGVALRPADIDAVAIHAGLLPRMRGGPMFWAERRGALVLRAELRKRAEAAPALFTPAPFFDEIIARGIRIGDLNRAVSPA